MLMAGFQGFARKDQEPDPAQALQRSKRCVVEFGARIFSPSGVFFK